ncbi:hypothetical protein R0K05_10570 [Planococcus sp. SIMBA_160]
MDTTFNYFKVTSFKRGETEVVKYVLIEKKDIKSSKIAEKLINHNILVIQLPNNPLLNLFKILYCIATLGKPEAIIYRYLNDFDNIFKNIIKILVEKLEYWVATLLKIKIFWICHNLDRETHIYNPKINKIRRITRIKYSNKIFVTDPELVNFAPDFLNVDNKKIDSITFGEMENSEKNNSESTEHIEINKKVIEYVKREQKENKEKVYFTICAGRSNHKTLHYERLHDLINEGERKNIIIRAIVIGPVKDYYKEINQEVYNFIESDDRVLYIDGFHNFDENEFAHLIDFYWRVYKDFSIPGTLYKAVFLKKPIITMNFGILNNIILNNKIGFVIENDFSNIEKVFRKVNRIPDENFELFSLSHNWNVAAEKLKKEIG